MKPIFILDRISFFGIRYNYDVIPLTYLCVRVNTSQKYGNMKMTSIIFGVTTHSQGCNKINTTLRHDINRFYPMRQTNARFVFYASQSSHTTIAIGRRFASVFIL